MDMITLLSSCNETLNLLSDQPCRGKSSTCCTKIAKCKTIDVVEQNREFKIQDFFFKKIIQAQCHSRNGTLLKIKCLK